MNSMQIIPTINCKDIHCVKKRMGQLREIFAGLSSPNKAANENWIQIDISDGVFTPITTWNEPSELSEINNRISGINIEVHLMVQEPEIDVRRWLEAGAKRIILHIESEFNFKRVRELCDTYGVELWLALKPDTPVEKLVPYLEKIDGVQILAVEPGPSGQGFQPSVLEKIHALVDRYSDVTIEVDGGMNPYTAAQVIEAGAKHTAVGSYIFESDDPAAAYRKLQNLTPLPAQAGKT